MRVFKTSWFARAARRARISDTELRQAADEAARGRATELGGGVLKKRLNRNLHRGIILAKGGRLWIYVHLFAKQDKASITEAELAAFRKLAVIYAALRAGQLTEMLTAGDLKELYREQA
ncbi:MAG: type II toxin-antitoxin system RelE/ParE family toxin [Gemmatimonadaceae bacterium]